MFDIRNSRSIFIGLIVYRTVGVLVVIFLEDRRKTAAHYITSSESLSRHGIALVPPQGPVSSHPQPADCGADLVQVCITKK